MVDLLYMLVLKFTLSSISHAVVREHGSSRPPEAPSGRTHKIWRLHPAQSGRQRRNSPAFSTSSSLSAAGRVLYHDLCYQRLLRMDQSFQVGPFQLNLSPFFQMTVPVLLQPDLQVHLLQQDDEHPVEHPDQLRHGPGGFRLHVPDRPAGLHSGRGGTDGVVKAH